MTLSVPLGNPAGRPDELLDCFETTAAEVFAVLCRLTVGDREISERLLVETYLHLGQAVAHLPRQRVDADWLVSAAVSIYLDHAAHVAAPPPAPCRADAFPDLDWTEARWIPMLEALRELDPVTRVVLDLADVEHRRIDEVAGLLGSPLGEIEQRLTNARAHLREAMVTEAPGDAFVHAQLWLGDMARERVRRALSGPADDPAGNGRTRGPIRPVSPTERARYITFAVAAVVGALFVLFARWVQDDPARTDANKAVAAADEATTFATTREVVASQAALLGDKRGRLSFSMRLAADLSTQDDVRPDLIVRYPSANAVGVSWTGPCNRPAASIQFTTYSDGIGVELRTGAFPVVSCVGMPTRWTVVVEHAFGDGDILPIVDGALDHTFEGYSVDRMQTGRSLPGRWFGSTLVDANNQPWVYVGRNCGRFGFVQRPSPGGAMFEVRTGIGDSVTLDPQQVVGTIDCTAMSIPVVLHGPAGSMFPQVDSSTGLPAVPDPAAPKDCHGPFGSATDVPPERSFTATFYDGDWSTWDGCLVRSDVIFSKYLSAACGWDSVRTITIAEELGSRMGPAERTHTYLRDPEGLVPGDIPPLLHYEVMPERGRDSGLRFGTDQLWTSPTSSDAIYIVTADDVERWPVVDRVPTCRD